MGRLFLVLVSSTLLWMAHAGTFDFGLTTRQGRPSKLRAKANERAQRLGKAVNDSSEYFVTDITIGTPPQKFSVALSFDNSALSVPDSSCIPAPFCFPFCFKSLFCKALCLSACCHPASFPPTAEGCGVSSNIGDCSDRRKFNRLKSSTYNNKMNGVWFCDGADLTEGRSFVGIDTIRMDDGSGKQLAILNATFGEIYVEATDTYEWFGGEFGIGTGTASVPTGYTPPILSAYKQGLIKDPVATLWLNSTHAKYDLDKIDPSVGKLTIAGLNTQNCGKVLEWHPLYEPQKTGGILLTLEKVSLGNATVSVGQPAAVEREIDCMTGWFGIFWSLVVLFGGLWLKSIWLLVLSVVTLIVYSWLIVGNASGKSVLILVFLVLNGIALIVEATAFLSFIVLVEYTKFYTSRFVPTTPESVAVHLAFILVDVLLSAFVQYIVYGAYKLRNQKVKSNDKTWIDRT